MKARQLELVEIANIFGEHDIEIVGFTRNIQGTIDIQICYDAEIPKSVENGIRETLQKRGIQVNDIFRGW